MIGLADANRRGIVVHVRDHIDEAMLVMIIEVSITNGCQELASRRIRIHHRSLLRKHVRRWSKLSRCIRTCKHLPSAFRVGTMFFGVETSTDSVECCRIFFTRIIGPECDQVRPSIVDSILVR